MAPRKHKNGSDDSVVTPEVLEPEEAAEEAASETPEVEVELSPLEAAQAEAAELKDKFVRLQAEWDNYRKRQEAQRESERNRAAERVVEDLLPVIDDFERALDHAKEQPDFDSFVEGIDAVHSKLLATLAKEKVEVIDPVGVAFDAIKHQAVGKKDDASVPDETVLEVFQKGYEMGGKVVRPAMVVVSTGGPAREPEPSDGDVVQD